MGWRMQHAKPCDDGSELVPIIAVAGEPDSYTLDDATDQWEAVNEIQSALLTLSDRERAVVTLRHLEEQTLDAIAERFLVTRERIRQIEVRALRKLRHGKIGARLKAFRTGVMDPHRQRLNHKGRKAQKFAAVMEHVPAFGSWREIFYSPRVMVEHDGEMRWVDVIGVNTEPSVCADFGGTEAVFLFELDGLRMGEAWESAKLPVTRYVREEELN